MVATDLNQIRGSVLCMEEDENCWVEQADLLQSEVAIPSQPCSCRTSACVQACSSVAGNPLVKYNQQHPEQQQQQNGKTSWESRARELSCPWGHVKSVAPRRHGRFLIPRLAVAQIHLCKSKPNRWPDFNLLERQTRTALEHEDQSSGIKSHVAVCRPQEMALPPVPSEQPPRPDKVPLNPLLGSVITGVEIHTGPHLSGVNVPVPVPWGLFHVTLQKQKYISEEVHTKCKHQCGHPHAWPPVVAKLPVFPSPRMGVEMGQFYGDCLPVLLCQSSSQVSPVLKLILSRMTSARFILYWFIECFLILQLYSVDTVLFRGRIRLCD